MKEFIVRCKPDPVVTNRFEVKLQSVSLTGTRTERTFMVGATSAIECLKLLPALVKGAYGVANANPQPWLFTKNAPAAQEPAAQTIRANSEAEPKAEPKP